MKKNESYQFATIVLLLGVVSGCVSENNIRQKPVNESQFTSLAVKDCKLVKHRKRGNSVLCRGKNRYKIEYKGNENLGKFIYLKFYSNKENKSVFESKLLKTDRIKIYRVGSKAEWRISKRGISSQAVSVIVPVFAMPKVGKGLKPSRYYIVVKLGTDEPGPCVIYQSPGNKQGLSKDKLHKMAIIAADSSESASCR